MQCEGNFRETRNDVTKINCWSMRCIEADIDHLTKLIEDRLVPQFPESIGGLVICATIRKQRKEQHLSQSGFDGAGGLFG